MFRDMYFITGPTPGVRSYLSKTITGAIYNFRLQRMTETATEATFPFAIKLVGIVSSLSDFNSTNFPELFI
jgi:hypothetical protein